MSFSYTEVSQAEVQTAGFVISVQTWATPSDEAEAAHLHRQKGHTTTL